jgi:hypothetical protein
VIVIFVVVVSLEREKKAFRIIKTKKKSEDIDAITNRKTILS